MDDPASDDLPAFASTDVSAGFVDAVAVAAAAVHPLLGGGDGIAVDGAAVDAMRAALARIPVDGRVVIGEGEKDDAPMLHLGERFGRGGAAVDLAVDPVDGTRLAAAGRAGAMAVVSIAPRGAFADVGPAHYLEKLVSWHPDASLERPLGELVTAIAEARGVAPEQVRVAVQDRPRNDRHAAAARAAGAEVVLFEHGDVERSLRAAQRGTDLDVVVGIGGAPEGVLTAAAVRALGGTMSARLAPQSAAELARVEAAGVEAAGFEAAGVEMGRTRSLDELCAGPAACVIAAVTDLDLGAWRLRGVRPVAGGFEADIWTAVEGARPSVSVHRVGERFPNG